MNAIILLAVLGVLPAVSGVFDWIDTGDGQSLDFAGITLVSAFAMIVSLAHDVPLIVTVLFAVIYCLAVIRYAGRHGVSRHVYR